ncbi:MAG: RloB family protein [Micromonosporaceae bacterium]
MASRHRRVPGAARRRTRRHEVYVFTEGEVTEPGYIDALKRRQSAFTVRVDDRHGNPAKLVRLAIEFKRVKDREAKQDRMPLEEWPDIWCVFDRDQHPDVDQWIEKARRSGVRVCFSHPCFEFWLLLHFEDHAPPTGGSCNRAQTLLRKHLPPGKHVLLDRLEGRFEAARTRAKSVSKQHERDGNSLPTKQDPSTDVWKFVDRLGATY